MPIRHPSENFLKYLVTTDDPRMQDNGMVSMAISSLGFPSPTADYLDWLRNEVAERLPNPFHPHDRYHRPSVRFMRQEGIYGMHNPDAAANEATSIITHLRARPIVEELLLGHVEPVLIAKKVNARLGEHFTADGIDAYKHYYWNVALLRVEEWSALLENSDKRSQTLAILNVGSGLAMHSAGFSQEIESKTILQEMQEAMYYDFLQWKKQPRSSERTKMMATIAKGVTLVDERLMESNSLLKDSLKQFEKFRMQHARQGVAGMRDLAPDGNFTGSGAKLLEAPATKKKEVEVEETEE